MANVVTPPENMARYSLRSQDFSSIGNTYGPPQRTSSGQPHYFDTYFPRASSATMSYDGDCISLPFDSSVCSTADVMLNAPNPELQWHEPHSSGALCNESYPFLSIESDYENQDSSSYRSTHGGTAFGNFQWNEGLSHHSSTNYSAIACPRAFTQEVDTTVRATAGSASASHPPAAYSISPYDRPAQSSMAMYSNFQSNHYPPALSRSLSESTRPDVGPIATPDVNKNVSRGTSAEVVVEESDGDGSVNSEPYAQLIYRALMSTPEHKMVLREIYEWFEKHTDKARSKGSKGTKGWQNSIRHNLSMNGVSFET